MLSVAAVDGEGRRAEFSNFGRGVNLAAPGVEVTCLAGTESDRPTFRNMTGSTFSADIVAGVAALVMSLSDCKPSQVTDLLLRASTTQTSDGKPILDASAAIRIALENAAK